MDTIVHSSDRFIGKTKPSLVLLALILSLSAIHTFAQNPGDNGTPLALAPGSPEGSYGLGSFESVNLYSGNLSVSFPVLKIGGRGTAGYELQIPIEQKWMVNKEDGYDDYGNYYYSVFPFPINASTEPSYEPLTIGPRPQEWGPYECSNGAGTTLFAWHLMTVVVTDADGTEHELVDQATLGRPIQYPYCTLTGNSRGTVFISNDGSGMTFISDSPLYDMNGPAGFSGYLKMRDGTTFRVDKVFQNNGYYSYWTFGISWMRDPNGNKITFSRDSNERLIGITDSLNRYVTIERNVTEAPYGLCDRITYKGSANATRRIHISKGNLDTALRSDFTQGIRTYAQLFPELDDGSGGGSYDPLMVTSVWLPDNDGVTRRFKFLYNPYGELAHVEFPTGGAMEYDWEGGLASGYADGVTSLPSPYGDLPGIYRRVTTRRVHDVGNSLLGSTTYSKPEDFNGVNTVPYVTVSHKDADGHQLSLDNHFFYGSALGSLFLYTHNPQMIWNSQFFSSPFSAWKEGKEYQTDLYAADGQTLLTRTTQNWEQPSLSWWPASAGAAPSNNPYAKETITTLSDSGQVTKTTHVNPQNGQTMIDQFNNFTDTWIYDYGQGAPGGLLGHSHTEYLTVNSVNGVDYTNRTSASSPHMLSLPKQVSIFDSGGTERGRSTVEYDNYTPSDNFHAGLMDWSLVTGVPISGLDAAFTASYQYRGNTTAATRNLLSTTGQVVGSVTSYAQYDIAGHVVKVIDPRSTTTHLIATTISYDDCFGAPNGEARTNSAPAELTTQRSYAYPTVATNTLGQSAHTQFDYYLSRSVDEEDANGVVSSIYSENDPLDRITKVIHAAYPDTSAKSQTVTIYDDVNRVVTTNSDQMSFGDGLLQSKTFSDGLGRTTETRQYEGGTNYIVTRQQYDGFGRAYKVSNPFRPWQSESPIWTTTGFDALGRVISRTTPDNSVITTFYSGNTMTVTDQAGKRRKNVRDGLGRLTSVYEDPSGLNYLTSYAYDVLDNLIAVSQYDSVSQITQSRYFMYDSLSRLIRARNPEQAVNASLPSLTDPSTGNSQWCVAYTYDENGNLTQKTDARGVIINYLYDDLNRNTTVSYANDAAATPTVNRHYDGATNGKGRFWYATTTGTNNDDLQWKEISAYDTVGEPLALWQNFRANSVWSPSFLTQRTYNRAGDVMSQSYPSGRTVNYSYDYAGRTSNFSGNLGDGVSRTYASALQYDAASRIQQEQYGTSTPLYHKQHYNVRGQLYDNRLSTVSWETDQWNWNRGALLNFYDTTSGFARQNPNGGTDDNGNLRRAETWIPNDDQLNSYSWTQQNYSYDSLNRLTAVTELQNGSTPSFAQSYLYDRYGNRRIDTNTSATWGTGINSKGFTVATATNRLGVPSGQSGTLTYDNAGNLVNDTYSGTGSRSYNGDNRMFKVTDNAGGLSSYAYDMDGKRVRRNTSNEAVWQLYGMDGELDAEYLAGAAAALPQKEYGYRSGQLLVTASNATSVNVALGKAATESSTHATGTEASKAVDGNTDGALWDGHASGTNYAANSWWQVDLASIQQITSIQVWGRTDCCPEMTSNFYVFVSDNPFTSTDLKHDPEPVRREPLLEYGLQRFSGHISDQP